MCLHIFVCEIHKRLRYSDITHKFAFIATQNIEHKSDEINQHKINGTLSSRVKYYKMQDILKQRYHKVLHSIEELKIPFLV